MRSMLGNDPFVLTCVVVIGICAAILVVFIAALGARRPQELSRSARADDNGASPDRQAANRWSDRA
jgi:hypothetical protein